MATCYLVLGTQRSGTSLCAGILHHLGVFMGDTFIDLPEWNPKGSFNDVDWESACAHHIDFDAMKPLIAKRESLGRDWGAKCTGLAGAVEFISANCRSTVKLIFTKRERRKSEQSLRDRSQGCLDVIREVLDVAERRIKAIDATKVQSLIVDFEESLANPAKAVERIARFAGRPVTAESLAFPDPSFRRY